MENKKQGFDGSSSSSSYSSTSSSLDHIFGSKDSSTSSSSGGAFASIFPPPSTVLGRNASRPEAFIGSSRFPDDAGNIKYGNPGNGIEVKGATSKGRSNNRYQNEIGEPCYLSSSIYYGGQENYSPRTNGNADSHHIFKKDDNESNGNNSESASRGNWWQGSLYY